MLMPDLPWQVRALSLPSAAEFNFADFLANPSDVRDWNIQGLPADDFSTENGVTVTRGRRWPLMIDPQGQVRASDGGRAPSSQGAVGPDPDASTGRGRMLPPSLRVPTQGREIRSPQY